MRPVEQLAREVNPPDAKALIELSRKLIENH